MSQPHPGSADQHVVVVGGGIAGLAAAYDLGRTGVRVTLLEASDRLGGKLHTTPFAGRLVDEGADAFLLRVPWAIDLCRELGTADTLIHPAARTAYVWSRGALCPLPPQHMGVPTDIDALVASGLLSDAAIDDVRADLARTKPIGLDGDRSITSVVAERLGQEVLERLVDPLVGGINAGDTRTLSVDTVVPQIAAAARDAAHPSLVEACRAQQAQSTADPSAPIFASPPDGMEQLVRWLGEAIAAHPGTSVHLGAAVAALEPGSAPSSGWLVHLASGEAVAADAVVLALPAHALAPLVEGVAAQAAATFGEIEHASVAMVTLAFRTADVGRPLDRSGFLIPRVEHTKVLSACSWASAKWAHLGPDTGDGTYVLRASAGRAGDEHALDLDDDDLVAALVDDLGPTMAVNGAPTEARVTRWMSSLPQYTPGHLERIEAVEATLPATVALAGAALRGVGVPACIGSGRSAAAAVLRAVRPNDR